MEPPALNAVFFPQRLLPEPLSCQVRARVLGSWPRDNGRARAREVGEELLIHSSLTPVIGT